LEKSPFVILSVHFVVNFLLQPPVSNPVPTLYPFVHTVRVSGPYGAKLQIQLFISCLFYLQTAVIGTK
jgi:hypothetical protein